MADLKPLRSLAKAMGVHAHYTDGLGKRITVAPETLLRVCVAAGAQIADTGDAVTALRDIRAQARRAVLPPILVAWDGNLPPLPESARGTRNVELQLADGGTIAIDRSDHGLGMPRNIPLGYHKLVAESSGELEVCTVIAAPMMAWRRPDPGRSWGVAAQLAALRSSRSRSVGDLCDLRFLCDWLRRHGGDVMTLLPLLPTFNSSPPEPSPYSPVSRLFWSELVLDLEHAHHPCAAPETLDVTVADAEIRAALKNQQAPPSALHDDELIRYARFRGAQARLGRNWRDWPTGARAGQLESPHVDPEEERFHLVAQSLVRHQLRQIKEQLGAGGFRLGLDLAVGVHPDGYDPWSRQSLFAERMSVGAPPDAGFPSGQDWGFAPVLPEASRRDGHRYLAASIAHQAAVAGVLRVDHIMAMTRLYWIPHGLGLHEGTYVSYPADELFAVLALESHRNQCEVVGENLGTVPREIGVALPRHRIWGMYLAEFEASGVAGILPPTADDVALVGTHDTPTFAGWLDGADVAERRRHGLLSIDAAPAALDERFRAVGRLARQLGLENPDPGEFLARLLEWLGESESLLVVAWLEDLWLEDRAVNLPGTPSSQRPNWQRPMSKLLEEIVSDPVIAARIGRFRRARTSATTNPAISPT
jgi:4-alpha-glucanotransferase